MDLTRLWEGNLWWAPSAAAAVLLFGLVAYVAWRRPPAALALPLSTALLGALLFTAGDLGSIFAANAEVDWIALLVLYAGHALLVPGCFYLALGVAKSHPNPPAWTRSRWVRLPIPWYALLWLSLVANPWHGLFLTPNPGSRSTYHVLWFVFGGSGYALTALGFGLFIHLIRRSPPGTRRSQGIVMATATGITWIGNLAYVITPTPLPFDPTAVGLCFTGTLFLVGAYRGQLFALNPIALKELAHQDSDGVFVVDRNGGLLFCNPAMNHWLGDEAPAPGDPGLALLAGRLRLPSTEADAQEEPLDLGVLEPLVLSANQPPGGHLFRALPNGEWIRLEATPIRNPKNDEVAGHAIRVRDETTLHELIAAAADQASTLTAVMSASDEGILVHLDGTVRWANPQFHQIWGMPPEMHDASPDEIAEHCYPLVTDLDSFKQRVEAVRREPGSTVRRDLELRDGRILEHSGTPLPRGGQVVGRVWRVRDVTEQRRSEETVRRTQKLESLGLMAGGIAHDFNNLLVAVLGNASLARAELPDDSEARRRVEDIERAAERASDLTRQLLTYTGQGRLEVEALDLSELARGVATLMEVSISKRVHVELDLPDSPPAVTGDASQLRQLVMNLLLNAAEAIGDQPGTVELSVAECHLMADELESFTGDGTPVPGRWLALRGPRHRQRHGRGGASSPLRSILQHQIRRPRPRAGREPRDRPKPRRFRPGSQRTRRGRGVHGPLLAGVRAGAQGEPAQTQRWRVAK